jgi:hypothetical protein
MLDIKTDGQVDRAPAAVQGPDEEVDDEAMWGNISATLEASRLDWREHTTRTQPSAGESFKVGNSDIVRKANTH